MKCRPSLRRPSVSITCASAWCAQGSLRTHADRLACGRLGLASRWHCSQPNAAMPCRYGTSAACGQRGQRQPQHAGRVAPVEQVVLAEFERSQVARDVPAPALRAARSPRAMSPSTQAATACTKRRSRVGGVYRRCQRCAFDERARVRRAFARLGEHVQRRGARPARSGLSSVLRRARMLRDPRLAGDEAARRSRSPRTG